MGLFDHRSCHADDDDDAAAQAAASGANLRPVETIDFFAAERERMPARRPSPDHHDAGLEMLTVNTASTSPSAALVIYDQEEKGEMAAVEAELRRIKEDNRRLSFMITDMYALLQNNLRSSSSSSSSTTPPSDALDVRWPLILDLRWPPSNDVPESSNAAAMRGRGEVGPVDDGGLPKRKKGKEVTVDEASDDREESSEDDDQHHGQNSNKKLKLSPAPPEKEEKAASVRKPRVIVRIRTETDVHATVKIDGCHWRKYGQKTNKSSAKTPRCYYRCSTANHCPMRKHMQKCADDDSIVNVTYQGAHNHPLSHEAVPMARAIAAALQMVMSGSMPYGQALMDTSALAATMPPIVQAPRTAAVSTLSPFPTALLDLSKSPDPAGSSQVQPPAAQFPAAFADGATPGVPSHLLQMSAEMLAAAFADFLRGGGGGGGGGNGGAH